jgi:hypothetical protein
MQDTASSHRTRPCALPCSVPLRAEHTQTGRVSRAMKNSQGSLTALTRHPYPSLSPRHEDVITRGITAHSEHRPGSSPRGGKSARALLWSLAYHVVVLPLFVLTKFTSHMRARLPAQKLHLILPMHMKVFAIYLPDQSVPVLLLLPCRELGSVYAHA